MVTMGHLQILFLVALFIAGIESQHQDSTISTSTSPPKQPEPQNFTAVLLRANAITLRWDQPSDWTGEGIGYVITRDGLSVQLQGINNCQVRVTSLKPSTNYTFSLVAVSQESPGVQIASDPVTLVVLTNSFDEPSEPRNFKIVYLDGDQALLGWDPPKQWNAQDGGYVITTIEEDGTSSSVRLKKNVKRFNPKGIQTGVLYIFEISAYNREDGEEKRSAPLRLQLVRRPEKPKNLKIGTINETTIDISWDKPEGEEVDGYNVYHVANYIGADIIKPDVTSYVIEDLTPWTNCFISVSSYKEVKGSRVTSENITAVVKTDIAAPGKPKRLAIVNNKGKEITLEWKAPRVSNGPLSGYVLSWMHKGKPYEIKTKKTDLTIKDLQPWTDYQFDISAYNSMNGRTVRGEASSINANTSVSAPGAIDPPTIPAIESTSIIVKWKKPAEPNGPIDGYSVTLQQIDGPQKRSVTTKDRIYLFKNLFPWSEYNLTVAPFNLLLGERLYGPASYNLTRTAVGAPSEPEGLAIVSEKAREIALKWEAPRKPNGPLSGYFVFWMHDGKPYEEMTNTTNLTIKDLKPWTDYKINICAYNSMNGRTLRGQGSSIKAKTLVEAPGPIDPFTILDQDHSYFVVKWKKPTEPNGPVDGYLLTMQQIDGPQNQSVTTKDTGYIFQNLFTWTEYNLTVAPYNIRLGEEPLYGPETYNLTMTGPGAPSKVIDFNSTEVTNTSIEVTWEPPETPNGPLDGYLITVNVDVFIQSNITTGTNWTTTGWNPNTMVFFGIYPFNYGSMGQMFVGPLSTLAVRTDSSAPPKPIQNLTVSQTGNDEAFLDVPYDIISDEYGDIEEYMLLVTFNKSEDMLPRRGFETANETHCPSWAEAKNRGVWYRSSPEQWNFLNSTICGKSDRPSRRRCVIGQQKSCDKVKLCDGPLNSKTEYWAKIRGYTIKGWAETSAVHFTTGKSNKATSGIAVLQMIALLKIIM